MRKNRVIDPSGISVRGESTSAHSLPSTLWPSRSHTAHIIRLFWLTFGRDAKRCRNHISGSLGVLQLHFTNIFLQNTAGFSCRMNSPSSSPVWPALAKWTEIASKTNKQNSNFIQTARQVIFSTTSTFHNFKNVLKHIHSYSFDASAALLTVNCATSRIFGDMRTMYEKYMQYTQCRYQ